MRNRLMTLTDVSLAVLLIATPVLAGHVRQITDSKDVSYDWAMPIGNGSEIIVASSTNQYVGGGNPEASLSDFVARSGDGSRDADHVVSSFLDPRPAQRDGDGRRPVAGVHLERRHHPRPKRRPERRSVRHEAETGPASHSSPTSRDRTRGP